MPSYIFNHYTWREREILEALCEGLKPKQIAFKLGITLDTVRGVLRALFEKTRTHDQNSLILHVITHDWRGPYLNGRQVPGA